MAKIRRTFNFIIANTKWAAPYTIIPGLSKAVADTTGTDGRMEKRTDGRTGVNIYKILILYL